MAIIRIGLNQKQKEDVLSSQSGHEKVIIFYPEKFPLKISADQHVEWKEIIMYRTFYPLLETIDRKTMLVFNECLRTQNRSELTYNCAHHYCNQAGTIIVFEHFPFIEDMQDFMILLDLTDKGKYKGKSFSWGMLNDIDLLAAPYGLQAKSMDIRISEKERRMYEGKKKKLFDGLKEEQDPDILPRQLHIFAGNFKKGWILPDKNYVARNKRFKMDNVVTYKDVEPGFEYTLVDFPHRRIDLCDFLKVTGQKCIPFINSGLPVDRFYFGELEGWIQRLEGFYAKAGLFK